MSVSKKIGACILIFLLGAVGGYWYKRCGEVKDPRIAILEQTVEGMRVANQILESRNKSLSLQIEQKEIAATTAAVEAIKLKGDIRDATAKIEELRKQIVPLEPGFVRVPISFIEAQDTRFALSQKESKKWESAYNSRGQELIMYAEVVKNKDEQLKNKDEVLASALSLNKTLAKENSRLKFYLKVGGIAVGIGVILLVLR